MKNEWREWFIQHTSTFKWNRIDYTGAVELPRRYSWLNVSKEEVPFDNALDEHISQLIGHHRYISTDYIIIKYGVGDYIGEHNDYIGGTAITYACELQQSECLTPLTVEGTKLEEGYFNNTLRHEVKPIKAGTRISLTMFGKKLNNLL